MINNFVVDYQVIGACNLKCDFCDGAPKYLSGESEDTVKSGIDKLVSAGASTIVFTGGEPLLRKDMPKLIRHAFDSGLRVYLSTNAAFLFRCYDKIKDLIHCLGMPLDGSTPEMNFLMTRGREQFAITTDVLKYFKKNPPSHRVKVGTVVSKINLGDIMNVGRHIFCNDQLQAPNTWRLYQFTPLGDGMESRQRHEISDYDFRKTYIEMQRAFSNRDVSPLSNADSDNSYIFINPAQEIQVLTGDQYKPFGNLKTISVDELRQFRDSFISVIGKGGNNRRWLDAK